MNLSGGYLLILLVLFAANFALILGNYRFNNFKLILVSAVFLVASFLLMFASSFLNAQFAFLLDYYGHIFLLITAIIFVSMLYYVKTNNFKVPLYAIIIIFLISMVILSSQADLSILTILLYSLFVFVVLFVVYQLTKLLRHAKRDFPVIVGEYMSLFSILTFIFALTYNSTRALDYKMFTPFLILTPTYQLVYVVIGIIVVLIAGVLLNDTKGGSS